MAAHRVVDDLVLVDRGRRGHAGTAGRVVPPGELARAHRDRLDGRALVADVGEAVPDDRRELDQVAKAPAPDQPERRPEPDVRRSLRARFRCAVDRPLQVRLVDAQRLAIATPEIDLEARRRVAPRRDRDLEAAARRVEDGDAVPVGAAVPPPELDPGAAHPNAAVAVEDRDDELRVVAGRPVRRRGRCRDLPVRAAAAGEQGDEGRHHEDARGHTCSPTASSR